MTKPANFFPTTHPSPPKKGGTVFFNGSQDCKIKDRKGKKRKRREQKGKRKRRNDNKSRIASLSKKMCGLALILA